MDARFVAEGLETELKLAAAPAMLRQLRSHRLLAGEDRTLMLASRYFDTVAGALHRAGATLRLREAGTRGEQTFKSAAGDGAVRRGEWNAPLTGPVPDPAAFPPQPRELLESLLDGRPLQPLAVARIERTTRQLCFAGATIEAAFDVGTIEAGSRSEPVCELELELVEGRTADLFALAQQLPVGPELQWSVASKGERGCALALDLPFEPVRASDVALTPGMDVAQGFRAIAWNCLSQLLGNYREVIASGNPDAVHQSRVAMRRLRAALSLFGEHVGESEGAVFKAEWKAAAMGLAPARDLHVFAERVEAAAAEAGGDAAELLDRLRSKRGTATREAQGLLAGKAFAHLLLDFALWLEHAGPDADRPLVDFAAKTLGHRRRKLARRKSLAALSDEALHELRIKGKKLRYATEFFAALYPDENSAQARRAFVKALGRFQDCLGGVHDLAVAHEQRAHLFADLEPIAAARLSAQLGELLDHHGAKRKQLIKFAARALERVDEAPAWWKASPGPAAD